MPTSFFSTHADMIRVFVINLAELRVRVLCKTRGGGWSGLTQVGLVN